MTDKQTRYRLIVDGVHPIGTETSPNGEVVVKYKGGEEIESDMHPTPDSSQPKEDAKDGSYTRPKQRTGFPLKSEGFPDNSLTILHLSDLHITPDTYPDTMLQPLFQDLHDKDFLGLDRLDYLVVSGDLASKGKAEEFKKAQELISELIKEFRLRDHCIIVPGNHDIDWGENVYDHVPRSQVDKKTLKKDHYIKQETGFLIRNDEYPQRFKSFSNELYYPLTQDHYPLAFEEQCIPFTFTNDKIQFLAMNSCWKIDEYNQERSGIYDPALARGLMEADRQIQQQSEMDKRLTSTLPWLRIAVWHHPVTGDRKIKDNAFLERLQKASFQLCLHGHIHKERIEYMDLLSSPKPKLHAVATGTFGAKAKDRPESTPCIYSVLQVERNHSHIRVHTRGRPRTGGAWGDWAIWPHPERHSKRSYRDIELGKQQF